MEEIMTKTCRIPVNRTLIAGAAMAAGLLGLSAQSQAAMTADQFLASISEMKRICRYIHEPFFTTKEDYGCGRFVCESGKCSKVERKRRRLQITTITHVTGRVGSAVSQSNSGGNNRGDRGGDNGPAGGSDTPR
jgi:hypothetical protein